MKENMVLSKMDSYLKSTMKATGLELSYELFEKGICNVGNRAGIAKAMKKALRGEDITICCFGGSATRGACSTLEPAEESGIKHSLGTWNYVDHICDFWETTFGCKVNKVNAGMGATDTVYGIHRMDEDVLSYDPDLVVVEWSCNDGVEFAYKQATYECMIRRLLDSKTAVFMICLCYPNGLSAQPLHEPLAERYDLPMVSYKNAYFDYDKFKYLTSDNAHPNNVGYALIGLMVNRFFMNCFGDLDQLGEWAPTYDETPLCEESLYYEGSKIVPLKDIYEGKVDGIRIVDLGSFKMDGEPRTFAYRTYYGFTTSYAAKYEPMVIELDACKTLFLQLYRNTTYHGTDFYVELNDKKITSNTFTCKHGVDNNQVEWSYHWATERLCYNPTPEKVLLKIYPELTNENAAIRFYALLVS